MKKIIKLITTLSFLFGIGLTFPVFANVFDPDIEIKIKGLVCPSCAIGIKNGLQKTKLVKQIKFNTKKQLCIVEYISIEIHPSQIAKNFGNVRIHHVQKSCPTLFVGYMEQKRYLLVHIANLRQ